MIISPHGAVYGSIYTDTMREELDSLLCRTFPNLYRDRNGPATETCMVWGFPGDGWFLIIWNLSDKLEKMIQELPESERQHCRASQVKEKFGTLRFYMSSETDDMSEFISLAEQSSQYVCEHCGMPGKLRRGGWIRTLCDDCTIINDNYESKDNVMTIEETEE